MGECNHAASCTARDKGMQEINAIVDCEAPDETTKSWLRWIYWASQGRWCRKGAPAAPEMDDAEPGEKEADRVLAAAVEELRGQQIWAGIIPAGLRGRLVVKSGMAEGEKPPSYSLSWPRQRG